MSRSIILLGLGLASLRVYAGADGYVGRYTECARSVTGSVGIYHFQWGARQAELGGIEAAATAVSRSFLLMNPRGDTLYAANEQTSRISAYAVNPDGRLQFRDRGVCRGQGALSSGDRCGWAVAVRLDHGTGSIVTIPVAPDGALSEGRRTFQHLDKTRRAPHALQAAFSRDGRYVSSVDLGLDKVFVYRRDRTTGSLPPNEFAYFEAPVGSGPRHLAFSTDGTRVYLLTEISAELLTPTWNAAEGRLLQRATAQVLPPDYAGEKSGVETVLHPDGRWLHVSSCGTANDVAVFEFRPDGIPHLVAQQAAGGITPRFIGIAPRGMFLLAAGQGSNDISVFGIQASGRLEEHGRASLPAPVDILWR